jgi:hypothetical protein
LRVQLQSWNFAVKSRNCLTPRAVCNRIVSCLHPDSRRSASDEKLARAFNSFNIRKVALVSEAEMMDIRWFGTLRDQVLSETTPMRANR